MNSTNQLERRSPGSVRKLLADSDMFGVSLKNNRSPSFAGQNFGNSDNLSSTPNYPYQNKHSEQPSQNQHGLSSVFADSNSLKTNDKLEHNPNSVLPSQNKDAITEKNMLLPGQLNQVSEDSNDAHGTPQNDISNLHFRLAELGRKKSNRYDVDGCKDILGLKNDETPRLIFDENSQTPPPDLSLVNIKERKSPELEERADHSLQQGLSANDKVQREILDDLPLARSVAEFQKKFGIMEGKKTTKDSNDSIYSKREQAKPDDTISQMNSKRLSFRANNKKDEQLQNQSIMEFPESLNDSGFGLLQPKKTDYASFTRKRISVVPEDAPESNKKRTASEKLRKDSVNLKPQNKAPTLTVDISHKRIASSKSKSAHKPKIFESCKRRIVEYCQRNRTQRQVIQEIMTRGISASDPSEPNYLTWKKFFMQVVDRAKNEGLYYFLCERIEPAEEEVLAGLLVFLTRRSIRRKKYLSQRNLDRMKELEKKSSQMIDVFDIKKRMNQRTGIESSQLNPQQLSTIPWYVFYPQSLLRRCWDAIIFLCVLYNLIFVPLDLSLSFSMSSARNMLEWLIATIFWIDLGLNFITGYVDSNQQLVMDLKKIRVHYLKTWFIFDFVATLPFETIVNQFGAELGKSARIFQLSRFPRVFRLGKIMKFLENIRGANIWRILRLFLLFFMVSHWVGCIFYLITSSDVHSDNFYLRYSYALFQGLSMMVGETVPVGNNIQRIYMVFVMMIGQAISATIFGSMASLVKNINKGYDKFSTKMDFVNEHIRYYNLPHEFQQEIRMYYDFVWNRHRELIYGEEHLSLLDKQLAEEMQAHRFKQIISSVVFLKNANSSFVGKLIVYLKPQIITPGEIIYTEGEITKGLYILEKGSVELFSATTKRLWEKVRAITYFGLETLMMKTGRHWCSAISRYYSDLQRIDFDDFRELISEYHAEAADILLLSQRRVAKFEIFKKREIFDLISTPSSRSIGKYYEETYTRENIWIHISLDYQRMAEQKMRLKAKAERPPGKKGNGKTDSEKGKELNRNRLLAGTPPLVKLKEAGLFHNRDNSPATSISDSVDGVNSSSATKRILRTNTGRTGDNELQRIIDEHIEIQADYIKKKFEDAFEEFEARLRKLEKRAAQKRK